MQEVIKIYYFFKDLFILREWGEGYKEKREKISSRLPLSPEPNAGFDLTTLRS